MGEAGPTYEQFPPKCSIRMADGSDCQIPASHCWGPVKFCCIHFDEFAMGILRVKNLSAAYTQIPRHIDIVEEWKRQCKNTSLIEGAKCKVND